MGTLRLLSEQRRKLVDLRADLTNQWTANLKNYFPQALKWVGPLKRKTACDFLKRWPSLQVLQRAKPALIFRFFKSHRVGGSEKLHSKLEEIKQARALTHDAAIVTAASLMTQSLAGQILQLNESIQWFDSKIEELFKHHPDHFIFSSRPGSGKALRLRLLTIFGEDRDRFQCAAEVQTVSGIAPCCEAVARPASCLTVGPVPSSSARAFTNSPLSPGTGAPGRKRSTRCRSAKGKIITSRCAL